MSTYVSSIKGKYSESGRIFIFVPISTLETESVNHANCWLALICPHLWPPNFPEQQEKVLLMLFLCHSITVA